MNDNDVNVTGLVTKLGLNRRQFMAATTGMAAAAAVTAPSALASPVGNANGILIPAPKRGIILYTVRDAVSRDPLTSDLASGFKEVLTELSNIGYRQIEFAGLRQHANAEGGADLNNVAGATLLRSWLDANGLEAEGNHGSVPSSVTDATITAFDTACEIANILGMGHIGTGSDPTNSALVGDWQAAAERWNFFGERASRHGLSARQRPARRPGTPDPQQRHPAARVVPRQHRPQARVPRAGHLLGPRGAVQAPHLHRR